MFKGANFMANLFFTPQYIIAGENALDMAKDYLKSFGKSINCY